jgi:hypothetical protein
MIRTFIYGVCMVGLFALPVTAAKSIIPEERLTPPQTILPLEAFNDGIHHWNLEHKDRDYPRYSPDQSFEIATNFVAWQNKDGGWPRSIVIK